MSQENVEIVRRVYEAWNRDDLDAVLLFIHPDFELRQPPDLFLGVESAYCGHAGLRAWWATVKEPWVSLKSHIERTLDGGDAVVSVVQLEGVGRESGAKVALPSFANAWTLRSRLVVTMTAYYSLDEALEAVGLWE